jgi:phage-related protein
VFVPAFSAIGAVVQWVWSSIIQPVFGFIASAIGVVVSVAVWFWNTFGPIFIAVGNLLWTVWSGMISVVFALLKLAFMAVWAVIQLWWANVKFIFNMVAAVFLWIWSSVISPIMSALGAVFTWLWSIIQPVLSAVGALFIWLWANAISPVVNFISAGLSWLWGVIVMIFNSIVVFIQTQINAIVMAANGVTSFVNAISGHFQSMVNAVRDKINSAITFVRELPGKIIGAIGDLGSILYNAGQNVINGLINGISSRIGALRSKIAEAAKSIRDALPFSPAKYGPLSGGGAPDIAGATIVDMVVNGIRKNIPDLYSAATDIASAVSFPLFETKNPTLGTQTMTVQAGRIATMAADNQLGTTAVNTARNYTITVNAIDPRSASRSVMEAIAEWERSNGSGWRAKG